MITTQFSGSCFPSLFILPPHPPLIKKDLYFSLTPPPRSNFFSVQFPLRTFSSQFKIFILADFEDPTKRSLKLGVGASYLQYVRLRGKGVRGKMLLVRNLMGEGTGSKFNLIKFMRNFSLQLGISKKREVWEKVQLGSIVYSKTLFAIDISRFLQSFVDW